MRLIFSTQASSASDHIFCCYPDIADKTISSQIGDDKKVRSKFQFSPTKTVRVTDYHVSQGNQICFWLCNQRTDYFSNENPEN